MKQTKCLKIKGVTIRYNFKCLIKLGNIKWNGRIPRINCYEL